MVYGRKNKIILISNIKASNKVMDSIHAISGIVKMIRPNSNSNACAIRITSVRSLIKLLVIQSKIALYIKFQIIATVAIMNATNPMLAMDLSIMKANNGETISKAINSNNAA